MPDGPPVWVVVDIGCLECHNTSELVGVYLDPADVPPDATPAEDLTGHDDWRGSELRVVFAGTLQSGARGGPPQVRGPAPTG